jgi:hypothetical protein
MNPGTCGNQTLGWLANVADVAGTGGRWRIPLLVLEILFGVIQDGGGVVYWPGGPPIPIGPWGPRVSAAKQDILLGLAIGEIGHLLNDPELRRAVDQVQAAIVAKAQSQLAT